VAQKERFLIDQFNYKFEKVAASENIIKFSNIQIGGIDDSFQKLSAKANNFLLLHPHFDVGPILIKLAQLPQSAWEHSGRENEFEAHRQTQALQLIYDNDFRHFNPTYLELYAEFEQALKPLIDLIGGHYQHNGFVVRLIFTKLAGHGKNSTPHGWTLLIIKMPPDPCPHRYQRKCHIHDRW